VRITAQTPVVIIGRNGQWRKMYARDENLLGFVPDHGIRPLARQ